MDDNRVAPIATWVTRVGLAGVAELDLLRGFCERAVAAGLPLSRATVIIDTLHPIHEGRAFRWGADQPVGGVMIEFGRTNEGEAAENWRRSPLNHLFQSGASTLRRCFARGDPADFPALEALRSEGETDYLALIQRFAADGVVGEMDCVYSYWTTKAPGGFRDGDIAALERLVPPLALAVKCGALARIATTLVETYLGRDAGRRVLAGRIARGVADRIDAVLWFSDLRGFTHLTEAADPSEIIPFLNDYAEATITSVYEAGGDVLKLIGDGTLAIFTANDPGEACASALRAEALMRERVSALNERRREAGLPHTKPYLGLHIGEVLYGNIGGSDRLDFTVVGPAVNEVSRIAGMCRSAEQEVLVSSAFAAALGPERARLVSVGRYALRGVGRAQDLFTLER
jgi:adenylate cyclase